MNEKTKKILRYVACGLGGLALGIGLLGGLSMCATSNNANSESVNTILSTERVRHNQQITTANGGYTGYKFTFQAQWPTTLGNSYAIVYNVDLSDYSLSVYREISRTNLTYWTSVTTAINNDYELAQSSNENQIRFIAGFYYTDAWATGTGKYQAYFSFVEPRAQVTHFVPRAFLMTTSWPNARAMQLQVNAWAWSDGSRTPYFLNYGKSSVYLFDNASTSVPVTSLEFQDVDSYYKELGYTSGKTDGYSEGYDDAYAEKDSGIAFTSCGVYPNAHVTLETDETIGNFKYMYLCHYITKPGYDEHTIYIMWTTNANTGQYLGEVIDRNDSDSYDPAVTLGFFTQQPTSSVTITATEDMEFGLWVGYITTFHNRGEITNSILWFQGGTSESDMQIYQNGYDEGYQNGNQQGQETGYEEGYDRGHEVGDAEGYSRGYTEGFNQTNTKNVFSLFTSAFDSVASFFDLKIFGFLPLYWFFLAPLFIALISLLMRMVKH